MINAIGKVLAYGASGYIFVSITLAILIAGEVLPPEAAFIIRFPVILIADVTGPIPADVFAGTLVAIQFLGFLLMSNHFKRKDE